jgi:hypothetical protein
MTQGGLACHVMPCPHPYSETTTSQWQSLLLHEIESHFRISTSIYDIDLVNKKAFPVIHLQITTTSSHHGMLEARGVQAVPRSFPHLIWHLIWQTGSLRCD